MAKLIRKTQKVFGQDGATDQFAVFGTMKRVGNNETPDYSKDIEVIQSNAAYSQGWQDAVIANYAPFMEELNSICYSLTYQMSYLLQNGVPEWDDGTTYYINSIVVGSNSLLYRCLTDNCLNVDPTTDDGTNWYNYSLYGANQDLSNLTTAGIDKLHALKGYLDSGKILSDPQLFEAVYGYNHSTFDVLKFTKAGSPTITDNGVASVTADGNMTQRVSIPFTFDLTAKKWSIISNFTTGSTVSSQYTIGSWQTNDSLNCFYVGSYVFSFSLYVNIDGTRTQVGSGNTSLPNLIQFRANTKYIQIVSRNNDTYTYTIYNASNPSETGTITITSEYNLYTASVLCVYSNASTSSLKSCNLKEVKVTVNDMPVFSGTKTGIDTIQPANYTVVGTGLTITDGIASGFTNTGARLEASIDFTDMNTFSIEGKFYHSGVSNGGRNQFIFDLYDTTLSANRLYLYNQSSGGANVLWNYPASDSTMAGDSSWFSYTRNAWQTFKFDYDGTNIKLYINGTLKKTSNTVDKTWLQRSFTLLIGNSNLSSNYNQNYTGEIDLNSFKIYVNGDLVYQPCLLIPYNESSTASKIVDVAYRDRVIDVYQQFGSANYYTIDETNQNATLPMGEVYGFIEGKASTDFDNVTQTAKNTSISWGMPDWSRAISKTVYTEYTATERGWINAEGKSADKKVGLTINTNIVAAAEATGTSDESCFACLVPIDIGDVYNTFKTGTNVQDVVTSIQFIPCKGEA